MRTLINRAITDQPCLCGEYKIMQTIQEVSGGCDFPLIGSGVATELVCVVCNPEKGFAETKKALTQEEISQALQRRERDENYYFVLHHAPELKAQIDIANTISFIESLPVNDYIKVEVTNSGHVEDTWHEFDASMSIPDLKILAAFYKEWHEKL